MQTEAKEKVRRLIRKSDLKEAIREMQTLNPGREIDLIEARYHRWEREQDQLFDRERVSILNGIQRDLLNLLDGKSAGVTEEDSDGPYRIIGFLVVAIIVFLLVFIFVRSL